MKSLQSIISSVEKLEAIRRATTPGRFFLVWGRTDTEAQKAVVAAYKRGDFQKGDPVIFAGWCRDGDDVDSVAIPAPRWTTVEDISNAELHALL